MMPAEPGHGRSHWVRELRRHHEGTLLTGDRAVNVRFVIDGACGRLIMSVERWVKEAGEGSLFLPEERDDALQVLIEFDEEEPSGAAQDRWSAYHGEPKSRHWASARVACLRREREVCEDEELSPSNPLRSAENRLLRLLNAERSALIGACEYLAGVKVPEACAVGVDPNGIDVRARFGIVRAEFPKEACGESGGVECPERAAEIISALLKNAGGAGG